MGAVQVGRGAERPAGIGRAARRAALLAALVLCLAGCVSRPVLELYGATISSAGPAGVGLDLYLQVNNQNFFDVQIRDVRVGVILAERYRLPPLQFNPDQWLAAKAATLVRVPVVVPWTLVAPLLATSAGSEEVSYRVSGLADVTAVRLLGLQRNDYPVDEEGSVSRAALLAAAMRGVPLGR
ncbi:MAG: hypothetical protein HY744_22300 [Deltaproteobacteria bacterium]|nr:hypothetical protein [Deltaproteobacteria bacterium]